MADNVTEGTQTPPNNEADENIAGRENQNHHVDHSLRRGLEERIEKKEEQILKMEASVFQLANYYFVFQGVILTVIINGSSSFKCKHFWLPLSLSVIGAILNFGSLLIIADRGLCSMVPSKVSGMDNADFSVEYLRYWNAPVK
ncbi:hypothetical protein BUALT_Bualt10G0088000 [Buddleja alternifolia]|uniref:Uncharacterized protein n=1 Tax=Buddleja alternifolia TaxID=168488 RepID=A0AAV6X1T6_9LAMI|nr:hypothetical protein BUALT_Bualt10G0088000 [Buddleja alternifolia]